jgi:hypothetical protein
MMENFVSISTILANIAVIIGVIIAVMQLHKMSISNDQQQRAFLADHERRKKQSTVEFAHEVLEQRTIASNVVNEIFNQHEVINVTDSKYLDNKDIQSAVTQYLNLMERISVGINFGVYDIGVFMRITGRATILFYERLEPIIRERRRASGRASQYQDFEHLVNTMKTKYAENEPPMDTSANIIYSP